MEPKVERIGMLCIATLAFVCYFPSLFGDFVFDDTEAILNNGDVKLHTSLSSIFFNDFWGTKLTSNNSHKSYRPLTVLTFRFNSFLTNGVPRPFGFHLVNVAIHSIVSALTLPLYLRLSHQNSLASFVGSLLFACHPVHSEAVAGVVGRADLLATLMSVIAMLTHLSHKGHINAILASLFAGAALFCKETGLAVVGVCAGLDFLARRNRRLFIFGISAITLLGFRLWLMGFSPPSFHPMDNPAAAAPDLHTRVSNYAYLWLLHCWLLFCPVWLCFDWSMGCVSLIDPLGGDPRAVIVLVAAVTVVLAVRGLHSQPAAAAASLIGAASFAPASNLFVRVGFVVAERILYLPSVGFCLLIGLGFGQICRNGWARIGFFAMVILIGSHIAKCWERSNAWGSERKLFMSALKVCPQNAKVHYNVAKAARTVDEAIAHYRVALDLYPDYEQAMNNLANALRDLGHLDEAETLLRRAIAVRYDFPAAWMNLGIVLANTGRNEEAELAYKTAMKLRPRYPDCLYNLGNLALARRQEDKALSLWREVVRLKPTHAAAWNNVLVLLEGKGEPGIAENEARKALEFLPEDAAVHFHLGSALGRAGKLAEAEPYLIRAAELRPDRALYRANLGVLYHRWRRYEAALHQYTAALTLDPKCPTALRNLPVVKRLLAQITNQTPD